MTRARGRVRGGARGGARAATMRARGRGGGQEDRMGKGNNQIRRLFLLMFSSF
jgi:hypothetical protein